MQASVPLAGSFLPTHVGIFKTRGRKAGDLPCLPCTTLTLRDGMEVGSGVPEEGDAEDLPRLPRTTLTLRGGMEVGSDAARGRDAEEARRTGPLNVSPARKASGLFSQGSVVGYVPTSSF
jgi:hypothetical protein